MTDKKKSPHEEVNKETKLASLKEKVQEVHKGIFDLFPETLSKQTTLQMLETVLMWVSTANRK